MRRLSFALIAMSVAFIVSSITPEAVAGKSRYERVLKSLDGRRKLVALAAMEEAARIDPAAMERLIVDGEPLVRARCAEVLGRIGDPGGTPYLAKLAGDTDELVVATAVYSLGLVGDTLALEPLKRCLGEKSKPIKMRALEALGKTGRKKAAPIIVPWLRHFNSSIRARAALALAFTGDSASASNLDATIQDPDAHVASCAAYAMGRLGYRAGAESIAALLSHEKPEVRFRAVEALGRLKAKDAVPMIAPLTKDKDRWVAIKAAETLGRIGSTKGADALAEVLASSDSYLKTAALGGLAVIGEKRHFASVKPLLDDPSAMVRRAALGAVAATLKNDAREALLEAFERGTAREQSTALELLGAVGAPGDLALLVQTLCSSGDHILREGAAAGLGSWEKPDELGKPCGFQDARGRTLTPLEALLEAADGGDWVVASIAIESLGKTGLPEIVPNLIAIYGAHALYNDGDRKLAVVEAIGSNVSKIKREHVERFALSEFFARACADGDARVATAAAGAAAKFDMKLEAASASKWERGTLPWGEPALPLGEKKILVTTPRGEIEIALYGDEAPNVVQSILTLARNGFYDGLAFHRIVPGFVIQGGCPRGDGWGDAGYLLRNQINMHRYERGTVGMADSGKDTAGSQFFITHTAQPHLNGRYVIVGKVTRGMEAVDAMEEGDTFSVRIAE